MTGPLAPTNATTQPQGLLCRQTRSPILKNFSCAADSSAIGMTEEALHNGSELQDQLAAAHVQAWRWALLCAGRQHDLAQDALQNSYLAILDGSARFAGVSSFQTFLFAVIRRQIQLLQRRSWLDMVRPQRVIEQVSENALALACTSDAHLEHSLDAARLWHALELLPPRQREVLALVFGHDMSIAQAATVLNLRLGTARTHYARGKAALRASLGLALEQEHPL